jgi:hypothetical protein
MCLPAGLDHPDVLNMVKLAVRRGLRMFDDYADLDRETLEADALGEVCRAWKNYDHTKSKPGTFAFRVANLRLLDISRRRAVERKNQGIAREKHGVRNSYVDPDEVMEGTEAELAEMARRFFVSVKDYFDQGNVPLKRPGPGRPTLNRAQIAALTLLQRRMGWSHREAARQIKANPQILVAIGVTESRSYRFFHRASVAVTKFANFFPPPSGLAAAL